MLKELVMKQIMSMLAVAGLMAASPALAASTVKGDPAKAQPIVSQVCAACHSADGNSIIPANPNLAGQHAEYITKQLTNFKSSERKNPIMMGMAATLSPDDMKNLGVFFSEKANKATGGVKDKSIALQGQKLYRGGNLATGVAACAGCHSPDGAGIPAQFPRLAGQSTDYVIAQLKAFRSGERANDPNKMMRMIAAKLTDQEIGAVAEYISALR
jgi:cytochrome c553